LCQIFRTQVLSAIYKNDITKEFFTRIKIKILKRFRKIMVMYQENTDFIQVQKIQNYLINRTNSSGKCNIFF